jgi:hypothetical protein
MVGLYFIAMGATVVKFSGFPAEGIAIMLFGGLIVYISGCCELRNLELRRREMWAIDEPAEATSHA